MRLKELTEKGLANLTSEELAEYLQLKKQVEEKSSATVRVGAAKHQPSYLADCPDVQPAAFTILSGGQKLAKDNTFYYTVRLANGVVTFLSTGVLRAEQESGGIQCFTSNEFPKEGESREMGLNPNLMIGIKSHQFVFATA
jgi:hypothetical protein